MFSAGQQVNIAECNATEVQAGLCTSVGDTDEGCNDFVTITGIEYSRLGEAERSQYNQLAAQCLAHPDPANLTVSELLFLGSSDENGNITLEIKDWLRDLITPLMCNPQLSDETRMQCENAVRDSYNKNWSRVPENLRSVFDGFVQLATQALINACRNHALQPVNDGNVNQAYDMAFTQCMYQAAIGSPIDLLGTQTPFFLWNSALTYGGLFIEVANKLSGQICRSPTHNEILQGATGFVCDETEPETQLDPICMETHDSSYWGTHPAEMERYRHCPHDGSVSNEAPPPDDCPSQHSSTYWETHQDEYQRYVECHNPDSNSEDLPCCSEAGTTVIQTGHCNPEC